MERYEVAGGRIVVTVWPNATRIAELEGAYEIGDGGALTPVAKLDPEACPGCGCRPGDGITTGCFDPDGCGYWRTFDDDGKDI